MTPANFLEIWLKYKLLPDKEQKILNEYYKNYTKYFGEYIKYNYNNRFKEILCLLSSFNKPKILDIGHGCGMASLFMSMKGGDITGIDIRKDRLDVAVACKYILKLFLGRELECKFHLTSVLDFDIQSKNGLFDLIWMQEVFHHLEPRANVIKKIPQFLKQNGFIVISEANYFNPLIQFSLLRRRGLKMIKEYIDDEGIKHIYGNERIVSSYRLNKLFKKEGIIKQSVNYFRTFPNIRFNTFCLERIQNLVPKFCLPLFVHYNYVGKKIAELHKCFDIASVGINIKPKNIKRRRNSILFWPKLAYKMIKNLII